MHLVEWTILDPDFSETSHFPAIRATVAVNSVLSLPVHLVEWTILDADFSETSLFPAISFQPQ